MAHSKSLRVVVQCDSDRFEQTGFHKSFRAAAASVLVANAHKDSRFTLPHKAKEREGAHTGVFFHDVSYVYFSVQVE